MSMTSAPTKIPSDIITEILLQLPAKDLLRFKSVCKSWYKLINSPYFINSHLHQSLATQTNLHLVFTNPNLHLGDFDTFDNAIELDYPFEHIGGGALIIGECKGLLCLGNILYNRSIVIYNPTTRTHKLLPLLPRPSHDANVKLCCLTGFGYDSLTKDYKVVRIIGRRYNDTKTFTYNEVLVYSLKTDSWSKVENCPCSFAYRVHGNSIGAFVNGALHWVNKRMLEHRPLPIIGFNTSTNSFVEVPMPEINMHDSQYCFLVARVLDDCLCIVLQYSSYDQEIWIMKEYGVVESWTKLYLMKRRCDRFNYLWLPIAFTKNRKELLVMTVGGSWVTSIDLETLVFDNADWNSPSRRRDALVCVENLLILDKLSDNLLGNKQHEGQSTGR